MIHRLKTEDIMQLAGAEWSRLCASGQIPEPFDRTNPFFLGVGAMPTGGVSDYVSMISGVARSIIDAIVDRVNRELAADADLLANCNPELLEAAAIHLMQRYQERTKLGSGG